MNWRATLQRFGKRFAICLIILGGLYLLFFSINRASHNKPTTSQNITRIRAALDQAYITGNTLSNFQGSNVVASHNLGRIAGQLELGHTNLKLALKSAPPQLKSSTRQDIQAFIDQEQTAIDSYKAISTLLAKPMQYDPSVDLKLSIDEKAAQLATRAKTAADGLRKAANDDSRAPNGGGLNVEKNADVALLISPATKAVLLKEADCLDSLSNQLEAGKKDEAGKTRTRCTNDYPQLRSIGIRNIVQASFNQRYQLNADKTVIPLLIQLDKAAKTTR